MKFYKLLLLLPFLLQACGQKEVSRKVCEYETDDPVLQVYNDVLTELVEYHFDNLYLGEDKKGIDSEWDKIRTPDSADYKLFIQKYDRLRNKRFGDSTKFLTIYFTTQADFSNNIFERLPAGIFTSDSGSYSLFLRKYNVQNDRSISLLSKPQRTYKAGDFKSCTFKVGDLGAAASFFELRGEEQMQAIGQISFSEIKWADKENGILYYEFFCGTKCGKGEFVSVRKVKGRWNIIETVQLWTA